jgi:hypothetical protein
MNFKLKFNLKYTILLVSLKGPAESLSNSIFSQSIRSSIQKEVSLIGTSNSVIKLRGSTGANSYSLILPSALPLANQVLSVSSINTGIATLNWSNPVGGIGTGTGGQIVYWSGAGNQAGSNDLFWDATNKRLGIGTSTPVDKLQISEPTNASIVASILARGGNSLKTQLNFGVKNSAGNAVGGAVYSDGSLGGGLTLQGNLNDQPSVSPHVHINTSGELLVNTTSDNGAYKLQINGDIYAPTARFHFVNSGGYSADLNLRSDGTLTTAASDVRLKKNIETIKNPLEKVMALRGVTYNWKDTTAPRRMIGMIAQEVLPIVPEIVFQNKTDGYYGINYGETSGLLIEAIKAQQQLIQDIKTELSRQQGYLQAAQQEIIRLKQKINIQ